MQSFLERKEVRLTVGLFDFGITNEQIGPRLANLSDQQLHQVAVRIDKQNPAGDGGFIVGILVIGILVLLFVYLLKRV